MRFIGTVIEKLQRHPKRIVFPEGAEPRVLQAARQFHALRLGAPIVLGERPLIKEVAAGLNLSLEGIRVIDPAQSEDLDLFVRRFEQLRRYKGIKEKEAREAMLNPNYYGAMMVAMHQADGFVSGASEVTGSSLRPLFQIIKVAPQATTASSCMIMEVRGHAFRRAGGDVHGGLRGDSRAERGAAVGHRGVDGAAGAATPWTRPGWRCCRIPPRAARRIRRSARCRPPRRWRRRKRRNCLSRRILRVNCRWTRRWCRRLHGASCLRARWRVGRTC